MSEVFFRTAVKTYIENWPHRLYNESIATALFQLTQKEMDAVIETNAFTIEETGKEPSEESFAMVSDLAKKITEHINRFPKGAYVKLGSRSPKDSYIGFKEGFCCQDGQKVNPFDIWTDPCLFNWNKDSFDSFEFRYNNNMRKTDLSL